MSNFFWKDKRVFLTGHTGFKGSWLSLWLKSLGADLTGYALSATTNPSLFELASIYNNMNSVIGDIRDLNALKSAITSANPEIVIHMAAQPLVRYSYENPVETYSTNVMGTVNLLECVRTATNVRAVINITTDKCYENSEWIWGYRENDPMGGYDPYSNSKACSELVTASYRSSFFNRDLYQNHGVGLATARAGNVIGGGDWSKDRLIPDIIRAFDSKSSAKIRNPNAIRPWQHVLEPLKGYLMLAELLYEFGPSYSEAWNFGPKFEDAMTVSSIADKLCLLWGEGAKYTICEDDESLHEANYLKLDISKARSRINWHPQWTIGESLEAVVDFHKRMSSGDDASIIMIDQINTFNLNAKESLII